MSLANMPSHSPAKFDPFGPHIDVTEAPHVPEPIHAPQGRVPVAIASLAPPVLSRPASRPDFIRGFGLDITEEEEEEEEVPIEASAQEEQEEDDEGQEIVVNKHGIDVDASQDMELDDSPSYPLAGDILTASQSRMHSRHVSKLSATLSIRSAGGLDDDFEDGAEDLEREIVAPVEEEDEDEDDVEDMNQEDAIGEWTGSEDVYLSDGEEVIVVLFYVLILLMCGPSRVSANTPILRMRRQLVRSVLNAACVAESRAMPTYLDVFPISLGHPKIQSPSHCEWTTRSFQTQVMRAMSNKGIIWAPIIIHDHLRI